MVQEFRMHPTDPQSNLWTHTASRGPEYPSLKSERKADVAVVGGGFTGLSAALHLAEGGAETVLLEAGPPGFGASGRNNAASSSAHWRIPPQAPCTSR